MSRTTSPSTQKPYSLVRVCRVWRLKRSTIYGQRRTKEKPVTTGRPGPQGPCRDAELVQHIKAILAEIDTVKRCFMMATDSWVKLEYSLL
ncbi:MAG: hypothetical protein ACLFUU_12335 [Desulfobacteraceae bacterium]